MTTQELYVLTADEIINRIQSHDGLSRFIEERAKFEGWLKVEIIDILVKARYDATKNIKYQY